MRSSRPLLLCVALVGAVAFADEGMWTFNNFPAAKVKAKYAFEPKQEWLDHVRLSAVRIAGGCSASIVSPEGLVLTNHHCAHQCIEQLSTQKQDFVKTGFFAKTLADEVRCPEMELNQLVEITDVTKRVQDATKTAAPDKFNDVQKGAIAKIEQDCAGGSDDVRCEVVTLYRGGRYDLYKYRRFQDIRLVFAPEFSIAFFGGDPDNFMFPRYDLDMSMVRIYGKDGKPMKMDHNLKWSQGGAKDNDVTFVVGNPGGTSRTLTVAQLEMDRDVRWPQYLERLGELRGWLTEYQRRGPEQKRHSTSELFYVENSLKAIKGRQEALADPAFFAALVKNEQELRKKIDGKPAWKKAYGPAFDGVAAAVARARQLRREYNALENFSGGELAGLARGFVRYADESTKPNEQRFKEFTDSRLPQLKQHLTSAAPIYDELEIAMLGWSLTRMREELTADHPVVQKVFGQKSPEELARELVTGTRLKDPKLRAELFAGGKAKIDALKDPMLEFVRSFDAEARAVRKTWEDEVEGPQKKASELIAKARFEAYGTSAYPDATFTLRISYGQVKGYQENGKEVKPFTTLAGAFTRHTGRDPFALPKSWLDAKSKLNGEVKFDFATDNDIIGGNSGSPVVNKDGELVGLVFDGNIQSLGGDYGFDEAVNRTVAVNSEAIIEALDKIYGAKRLVDELRPTGAAPKTGQP